MTGSLPRLVALFVLAGGLIALVTWLWWPRGGPAATTRLGPDACVECHADVVREWRASGHAVSWVSTALHAESIKFGGLGDCVACHASAPMLQTTGCPPPAREVELQHGTDCVACHALGDGRVAARHDRPDAPCRPVATPALTDAATCGRCHRAVHDDWNRTAVAVKGTDCIGCHMAEVARPNGVTGRHHGHRPSRDPAEIAKGLHVVARVADGHLDLAVANITAHNVPGERHFREVFCDVEVRDAAGVVTYHDRDFIRQRVPFRGERKDDRLAAGDTQTWRWRLDEPHGTVRVRILYKLLPTTLEDDLTVVWEETVTF